MFFGTVAMFVYLDLLPRKRAWLFYVMLAMGLVIGVLIVMPIGGADMPVVDLAVELLRRPGGLGHRLCDQQQGADHRRGAGRGLGLLPLDPHEPGDEPLVHQRALRRRGAVSAETAAPVEAKHRHPLHARRRRADARQRPHR